MTYQERAPWRKMPRCASERCEGQLVEPSERRRPCGTMRGAACTHDGRPFQGEIGRVYNLCVDEAAAGWWNERVP
eukprot:1475842-Prymnesium_polylepis.1